MSFFKGSWGVLRAVGNGGLYEVKNYGQIFHYLNDGDLLRSDIPAAYREAFEGSVAESFKHPSDVVPLSRVV